MFLTLLSTTLIASFADSLNPIAIAQQFVLQSTTRSKHDILWYISGIGLTNFVFGLLFYFGLANLIRSLIENIRLNFPIVLPALVIILGISLCAFIIYRKFNPSPGDEVQEEMANFKQPSRTLSSKNLFGIGVVSCLAELTSALPYIAYLTFLVSLDIHWIYIVMVLFIYNLLFNAPLYILYGVSLAFDNKLTHIYQWFQRAIDYLIVKVLPPVGISAGVLLTWFGLTGLV